MSYVVIRKHIYVHTHFWSFAFGPLRYLSKLYFYLHRLQKQYPSPFSSLSFKPLGPSPSLSLSNFLCRALNIPTFQIFYLVSQLCLMPQFCSSLELNRSVISSEYFVFLKVGFLLYSAVSIEEVNDFFQYSLPLGFQREASSCIHLANHKYQTNSEIA